MVDIIKKRAQYVDRLDQTLGNVVDKLRGKPEVIKVILFGSYAEDRRDLFTDLDLVVVMESEKDFVSRTSQLYSELDLRVDVDLLVYTPGEFNKMRSRGFLRAVLEHGQVIYERKS